MTLDPQCRAVIDRLGASSFAGASPAEMRAAYEAARRPLQPPAPEVERVEDVAIPGPAGPVRARLYTPKGVPDRNLPAFLYLHGGGWMLGSIEGYDTLCRIFADLAQCKVLSVDYRLAPEHPFPAGYEDSLAALDWLHANAGKLGVDPARLAIGGDSAGGNISAAIALAVRDRGGPALALQVLIYPSVDLAAETPSYIENGEGNLLTRAALHKFIGHYVPDAKQRTDWRASPLRAKHFADLAPAYILTAEHDPLRDEGLIYAGRLAAAMVDATHVCHAGMIHPFVSMGGMIDRAGLAQRQIAQALRRAFKTDHA
jgi:acetyl esterase